MIPVIDNCTYPRPKPGLDLTTPLNNVALKGFVEEIRKHFATLDCPEGCTNPSIELTGSDVRSVKATVRNCTHINVDVTVKR